MATSYCLSQFTIIFKAIVKKIQREVPQAITVNESDEIHSSLLRSLRIFPSDLDDLEDLLLNRWTSLFFDVDLERASIVAIDGESDADMCFPRRTLQRLLPRISPCQTPLNFLLPRVENSCLMKIGLTRPGLIGGINCCDHIWKVTENIWQTFGKHHQISKNLRQRRVVE